MLYLVHKRIVFMWLLLGLSVIVEGVWEELCIVSCYLYTFGSFPIKHYQYTNVLKNWVRVIVCIWFFKNSNKAHLEIDILLYMCYRYIYIVQIDMCETYIQCYICVSVCIHTESVKCTH